jgi:hypothetical protein
MLLARPGVLVVEISEARALAQEIAMTNGGDIQRDLPFYLIGQYRHTGVGAGLRVSITMNLQHGQQAVDGFSKTGVQPDDAATVLRQGADALATAAAIHPAPATASTQPESAIEAQQLAVAAEGFRRVGDWRQAYICAEASLLLDSDPPIIHKIAFESANELLWPQWCYSFSDLDAATLDPVLAKFSQTLPDLEYYLEHTTIRQNNMEFYFLIEPHFGLIYGQVWQHHRPADRWKSAEEEFTAMIARVLQYKAAEKSDDDSLQVLMDYLHPLDKHCLQMDQSLMILKEFSYRPEALKIADITVDRTDRMTRPADAEWQEVRRQLVAIGNDAIVRQADKDRADSVAYWKTNPNPALFAASNSAGRPMPKRPVVANPEVEFAPVTFAGTEFAKSNPRFCNEVLGSMSIGPDTDLFWSTQQVVMLSRGDKQGPSVLLGNSPPRKGQPGSAGDDPHWVGLSARGACFDGRFAWFVTRSQFGRDPLGRPLAKSQKEQDLIGAIDPKTREIHAITADEGLPPGPKFVAALAPGVVCVSGFFDRTWIAIIRLDLSKRNAAPSIKVIYEARDLHRFGDNFTDDLSAAYPFDYLCALGPPANPGQPFPRVLAKRQHANFILVDPNDESIKLFIGPFKANCADTIVVGNNVFWLGSGHANMALARSTLGDLTSTAPPIDVPQDGFVYDDGIYYFLGMDAHADRKVHFEIMGKDQMHPRILHSNLPYDEWGLGNLAETRSLGLVSFAKRFGVNTSVGPLYQVRFLKSVPETQSTQPSSRQN